MSAVPAWLHLSPTATAADVVEMAVDKATGGHEDSETIARYVVEALTAADRLLPAESRSSVEWKVRWLTESGGIALDEQHLPSREAAERLGQTRVGQYNITGWSVHHRTHRSFGDGSSWTGPWMDVEGGAS